MTIAIPNKRQRHSASRSTRSFTVFSSRRRRVFPYITLLIYGVHQLNNLHQYRMQLPNAALISNTIATWLIVAMIICTTYSILTMLIDWLKKDPKESTYRQVGMPISYISWGLLSLVVSSQLIETNFDALTNSIYAVTILTFICLTCGIFIADKIHYPSCDQKKHLRIIPNQQTPFFINIIVTLGILLPLFLVNSIAAIMLGKAAWLNHSMAIYVVALGFLSMSIWLYYKINIELFKQTLLNWKCVLFNIALLSMLLVCTSQHQYTIAPDDSQSMKPILVMDI